MMMLIDPYRYGVSGPATLEFKGYFDASGPVGDVWTFTDLDFGTAGQVQQAILAIHVTGQPGATVDAITVSGVATAMQVYAPPINMLIGGMGFGCGIAAATVTSATVDITVTAHLTEVEGVPPHVQLGLYRATNIASTTAGDSDHNGFADPGGTLTIDTESDGIIVAAGCFDDPSSWTGVTEEYDFDTTGFIFHTGGAALTVGGSLAVTCDGAGSTAGGPRRSMAVASFR